MPGPGPSNTRTGCRGHRGGVRGDALVPGGRAQADVALGRRQPPRSSISRSCAPNRAIRARIWTILHFFWRRLRPRSRVSRSRPGPPERVRISKTGSSAKVGTRKTERRPNMSLDCPVSGADLVYRTSGLRCTNPHDRRLPESCSDTPEVVFKRMASSDTRLRRSSAVLAQGWPRGACMAARRLQRVDVIYYLLEAAARKRDRRPSHRSGAVLLRFLRVVGDPLGCGDPITLAP